MPTKEWSFCSNRKDVTNLCFKTGVLHDALLEYWFFTNGLDDLDAPIARKFIFAGLFWGFVIFKALIEE